MKLTGLARNLKERIAYAQDAGLSFSDLVGLLVDDEWTHREQRREVARLRHAAFKEKQASLENITYKAEPTLRPPVL